LKACMNGGFFEVSLDLFLIYTFGENTYFIN
jgi:hypothetical protein